MGSDGLISIVGWSCLAGKPHYITTMHWLGQHGRIRDALGYRGKE